MKNIDLSDDLRSSPSLSSSTREIRVEIARQRFSWRRLFGYRDGREEFERERERASERAAMNGQMAMSWRKVGKAAQELAAHALLFCFTFFLALKIDDRTSYSWWSVLLLFSSLCNLMSFSSI